MLGGRAHAARDLGTALAVGAPSKRLGVRVRLPPRRRARWHYRGPRWDLPGLPPPALRGETQYRNAAAAIAALEALAPPLDVGAAAVAAGFAAVRLAGRFQVIAETGAGPTWILDVAHNPGRGARARAATCARLRGPGRTLAVCGILADKDAAGVAAAARGLRR